MRTETLGGLTVHITGGSDREGGGDGPAVVLLHGFGAPGTDLVGLWRVLSVPAETRFVFPEAPLEMAPGFGESRAWWMIDVAALERSMATGEPRDMTQQVPEGMAEARQQVDAMLDAVTTELRVPEGKLVLGGFSQGAMLSLDLALRSERSLAGLVLMSGTLLAEQEWTPRMPGRAGLPVLQTHGRQDPLLNFGYAERLRDHLMEAGLDLRWVPFNGQHEVPPVVLQALGDFLVEVLP